MSERVEVMPAVALRGTTVIPDMIVHFDISRPRSAKAVEKAMLNDQRIFLITQKDPSVEVPLFEDLYEIGTIGCVRQVVKLPQGILRILVEGEKRGKLTGIVFNEEMLEVEVSIPSEEKEMMNQSMRQFLADLPALHTVYLEGLLQTADHGLAHTLVHHFLFF